MNRPPGFDINAAISNSVRSTPDSVPFVGVAEMERDRGKAFRLRLGANESPFGTSPAALEAITAAAPTSHFYADPTSYALRQALQERLEIPMDHLLVASGIDELLGLCVRLLLNPGDIAVASNGSYPTFAYHVHGFEGRLQQVPYRNCRNDLPELARQAIAHRAKVLYLANPDNPTGTYVEPDIIQDTLQRYAGVLLLDEAYVEFLPTKHRRPLSYTDPKLIRFRTFSKVYGMAGLRIGYLVADPQIVTLLHRIRLHFGVNHLAQAAALAALGDEQFLHDTVAEVHTGRIEYQRLGAELGLPVCESYANFVMFDCATQTRAAAIHRALLAQDVFVRHPQHPYFNRYLRVTVGTTAQRHAFADALALAVHETNSLPHHDSREKRQSRYDNLT